MNRALHHSMDHGARIVRLQEDLKPRDCPQLLVTDLLNIRWLSGFTGSNAQILIHPNAVTLITDSRYAEQVADEVAGAVEVVIASSEEGNRPIDHLLRLSVDETLLFEGDNVTVSSSKEMGRSIEKLDAHLELVSTDRIIADLRKCKDAAEMEALRSACRIADEALAATLPWLRAGQTEARVARQLEWEMAERESERISFSTILASGPNGAKPHARPSGRELQDGDLVVIDFGATVQGYGSDMTRTLVVGGQPSQEQTEWYEAVWAAQRAGVEAVQVDAELLSIHQTTLDHLTASGQAGVYEHGTGHGVGLFIHERPILSPRSEGTVVESMALTGEPGAYIAGIGGVREEDLVIATADGPETISNFPKGLAPSL